MKKISFIALIGLLFIACNQKPVSNTEAATINAVKKDTLTYAFKPTYSSDITVPSHPENAQKVLTVWKFFQNNQVDSLLPFFADTITYHNADGFAFHGTADSLFNIAKKEMDGLDSLRFDISAWQSAHVNDKNEDWVNIWAVERAYPKKGKPDTTLTQENWMLTNGKVVLFDQYKAKLPK